MPRLLDCGFKSDPGFQIFILGAIELYTTVIKSLMAERNALIPNTISERSPSLKSCLGQ